MPRLEGLLPLGDGAQLEVALGGLVGVGPAAVALAGQRLTQQGVGLLEHRGVLPLQPGGPAPDEETGPHEEDEQRGVQDNHGSSWVDEGPGRP